MQSAFKAKNNLGLGSYSSGSYSKKKAKNTQQELNQPDNSAGIPHDDQEALQNQPVEENHQQEEDHQDHQDDQQEHIEQEEVQEDEAGEDENIEEDQQNDHEEADHEEIHEEEENSEDGHLENEGDEELMGQLKNLAKGQSEGASQGQRGSAKSKEKSPWDPRYFNERFRFDQFNMSGGLSPTKFVPERFHQHYDKFCNQFLQRKEEELEKKRKQKEEDELAELQEKPNLIAKPQNKKYIPLLDRTPLLDARREKKLEQIRREQEEKQQKELEELTFTPKINPQSRTRTSPTREQIMNMYLRSKTSRSPLPSKKPENDHFKPKINSNSRNIAQVIREKTSDDVVDRLYHHADVGRNKKNELVRQLTPKFTPSLNKNTRKIARQIEENYNNEGDRHDTEDSPQRNDSTQKKRMLTEGDAQEEQDQAGDLELLEILKQFNAMLKQKNESPINLQQLSSLMASYSQKKKAGKGDPQHEGDDNVEGEQEDEEMKEFEQIEEKVRSQRPLTDRSLRARPQAADEDGDNHEGVEKELWNFQNDNKADQNNLYNSGNGASQSPTKKSGALMSHLIQNPRSKSKNDEPPRTSINQNMVQKALGASPSKGSPIRVETQKTSNSKAPNGAASQSNKFKDVPVNSTSVIKTKAEMSNNDRSTTPNAKKSGSGKSKKEKGGKKKEKKAKNKATVTDTVPQFEKATQTSKKSKTIESRSEMQSQGIESKNGLEGWYSSNQEPNYLVEEYNSVRRQEEERPKARGVEQSFGSYRREAQDSGDNENLSERVSARQNQSKNLSSKKNIEKQSQSTEKQRSNQRSQNLEDNLSNKTPEEEEMIKSQQYQESLNFVSPKSKVSEYDSQRSEQGKEEKRQQKSGQNSQSPISQQNKGSESRGRSLEQLKDDSKREGQRSLNRVSPKSLFSEKEQSIDQMLDKGAYERKNQSLMHLKDEVVHETGSKSQNYISPKGRFTVGKGQIMDNLREGGNQEHKHKAAQNSALNHKSKFAENKEGFVEKSKEEFEQEEVEQQRSRTNTESHNTPKGQEKKGKGEVSDSRQTLSQQENKQVKGSRKISLEEQESQKSQSLKNRNGELSEQTRKGEKDNNSSRKDASRSKQYQRQEEEKTRSFNEDAFLDHPDGQANIGSDVDIQLSGIESHRAKQEENISFSANTIENEHHGNHNDHHRVLEELDSAGSKTVSVRQIESGPSKKSSNRRIRPHCEVVTTETIQIEPPSVSKHNFSFSMDGSDKVLNTASSSGLKKLAENIFKKFKAYDAQIKQTTKEFRVSVSPPRTSSPSPEQRESQEEHPAKKEQKVFKSVQKSEAPKSSKMDVSRSSKKQGSVQGSVNSLQSGKETQSQKQEKRDSVIGATKNGGK